MLGDRIFVIVAMVVGSSVEVRAGLIGDSVKVELINTGLDVQGSSTAVVGAGVEFPRNGPASNVFDIDFTDTQVSFTLDPGFNYLINPFAHVNYRVADLTKTLSGASVNAATTLSQFTNSRLSLSNGSLILDFAGLGNGFTISKGSRVVLDLTATAPVTTLTAGGLDVPRTGQISAVPGVVNTSFDSSGGGCDTGGLNVTGAPTIDTGNVHFVRLSPTGDSSCYLSVGSPTGAEALLFLGDPLNRITNLGFYWGSIDAYNSFQVLDLNGRPIPIDGFGDTVTGSAFSAFTGRFAPDSAYVNLAFAPGAQPLALRLISSNTAFEIDNLGIKHTTPAAPARAAASAARVPAPPIAWMFGSALLTLAIGRRNRTAGRIAHP